MRLELGEDEFPKHLDERRRWIDQHCTRSFMFDDLDHGGQTVGKLYRFEDFYEAFSFRMRF